MGCPSKGAQKGEPSGDSIIVDKMETMPDPTAQPLFPVEITEEAAHHLARLIARKGGPGTMIRIGVKGGGCSGLEYVVRLEESRRPDDLSVEIGALIVLCDPKSAKFLEGSTLQFSTNLMSGGLQFENPKAKRSCGCGTSFTPIDQE